MWSGASNIPEVPNSFASVNSTKMAICIYNCLPKKLYDELVKIVSNVNTPKDAMDNLNMEKFQPNYTEFSTCVAQNYINPMVGLEFPSGDPSNVMNALTNGANKIQSVRKNMPKDANSFGFQNSLF